MVQEGLDLSIRVGPVGDAALVARRVGSTTALAVAAPEYLAAHGEPAHPAELATHECIIFTRTPDPGLWIFNGADGEVPVAVSGRLRCNNIEAVMTAAVGGLGVALLPTWMLHEDLGAGRLVALLRGWQPPRRPISIVYPSRRFLAPRTRVVIDFLVDEFRLDPAISASADG
jgi:DNA-binding transcriptional LysR family regulator